MALTGHLSDLSLSELIEFFCNQRKTGCLNVLYPRGSGRFYLQSGSVVDAEIGVLRGIDAVYYALTLPNAAFEFKGAAETPERTINQPWTQVVLEGLRRLDEGITPTEAFPDNQARSSEEETATPDSAEPAPSQPRVAATPAFLSMINTSSISQRKPLIAGAVALALIASVAAIGVPAGWYSHKSPSPLQPVSSAPAESLPTKTNEPAPSAAPTASEADTHAADLALAAKRQREKDRAKARDEKPDNAAPKPSVASAPQPAGNTPDPKPGPKKVTVQVSYDESGRVVQASGADPTAIRIARQKHFPAGKAGTATITIPIN
jgi:Domain of unknown function (DUF4388)